MAFVIADRVRETTTTTGTGTITLAGAVINFETFTANLSNSDTTYYAIVDNTNGAFEVGLGTFTSSGTTLARSVIASSNSNNLVDFGAGTKDVFITVPASKIVVEDGSNNVAIGGTVTATAFSGSGASLTGVDVVNDTSPQLGGNLDVNGNGLVSTSNGNIPLTPNGTGVVRIDGSNGIDMQSGAISIKNSGAQSYIRFYCESSNAHYAQLQAPAHSDFSGNTTLTLPATTDTIVGKATTDTLTNKTFGDNVSFGDNNITNVGDIAVDSISPDGTDINVAVSDNSATAFTIKQGSDNYLVVDTGNSGESVAIGTGVSGTAISIGHTTSETTVNDNLTVTGNLTVSGTTTTVDSTTINVQNTLVFEGSTANEHETTLTTVDPTADRTISLPNQSGTLPVLAAASTTQITSTPEELNLLDGVSGLVQADFTKLAAVDATASELNLLDGGTSVGSSITIADSDGIIVNDGGTMKSVPASDVKTYASADSATKGFATAMAIAL
jgi:hypothetical protein